MLYTLIYRGVDIKFSFEFSLDPWRSRGRMLKLISTDLVIRIKSISHALIGGVFLYSRQCPPSSCCTVSISNTGTEVRREPQQPENGSDPHCTAAVGSLHSHLYSVEDLGCTPSPTTPPDRVQLQTLRYFLFLPKTELWLKIHYSTR
jgi:hypothetical protein